MRGRAEGDLCSDSTWEVMKHGMCQATCSALNQAPLGEDRGLERAIAQLPQAVAVGCSSTLDSRKAPQLRSSSSVGTLRVLIVPLRCPDAAGSHRKSPTCAAFDAGIGEEAVADMRLA